MVVLLANAKISVAVITVTSVNSLGMSKRIAQTSRGCSREARSSQN
jgi:hypothetical protein